MPIAYWQIEIYRLFKAGKFKFNGLNIDILNLKLPER
jgi:hypothetical protein